MIPFIAWYLFISLIGWAAFPIAYRLLPNLRDRGFAFSRAIGLLGWGFIFFLLASLRILPNNLSGVLTALVVMGLISWWMLRANGWGEIREFLRDNRVGVRTVEIVFFVSFALLALFRAASPEIAGTEKPMEMAFINSILKSPTFPPADPWLADYSISYYYFGYLMVAMITRITGVDSGIAFNLAISLWFALAAIGAYGIVHNLLARIKPNPDEREAKSAPLWAILAPVYVLVVSNAQGFLDLLHRLGVFWKTMPDGTRRSGFWEWLNIQEMCAPPASVSFEPVRLGGIWWWRASRILHDFDLTHYSQAAAGQVCVVGREIIDEFPFFSFLLADLHPHVLSIPFVMLAIGIALNLWFSDRQTVPTGMGLGAWGSARLEGRREPLAKLEMVAWLGQPIFWLAVITMGGLGFLNTWDFPIYTALFGFVVAMIHFECDGWKWRRFWEFLEICFLITLFGIIIYLPFYIGFQNQAGGIFPSLIFFTRGAHFWVMFGTLLVPIFGWLLWMMKQRAHKVSLGNGFKAAIWLIGGLWLASFLVGTLLMLMPVIGNSLATRNPASNLGINMISTGSIFADTQGAGAGDNLIVEALIKRLTAPGTWLTLLGLIGLAWALAGTFRNQPEPERQPSTYFKPISPNGFVLLLVLLGSLMAIGPEFFYLRDQFGWRMNTIFKFYYQVWMVWSLAAAYATIYVLQSMRGSRRALWAVAGIVIILIGLVYPFFGFSTRVSGVVNRLKNDPTARIGEVLTLDGTRFIATGNPDERAAIEWMRDAPYGVVVEAVAGSYQPDTMLMSTFAGQPALLGWPGHVSQWRGGAKEMGTRIEDIRRLYETTDWMEAEQILRQYNIRYVHIGFNEMNSYRVSEVKFQKYMPLVFAQNGVKIYEAPGYETGQPLSQGKGNEDE